MERSFSRGHGGIECRRCSVGEEHVLIRLISKPILTLKRDGSRTPSESMCCVSALKRYTFARWDRLRRSQRMRIDGVEQVWCFWFSSAPFGYFDVDLIGAIDATVGEETQDNVGIESIDRAFDEPSECPETELDVSVQFGTCPTTGGWWATKSQMELVILIQPNIVRLPIVWTLNESTSALTRHFWQECRTNRVHCFVHHVRTIDIQPS